MRFNWHGRSYLPMKENNGNGAQEKKKLWAPNWVRIEAGETDVSVEDYKSYLKDHRRRMKHLKELTKGPNENE